MILINLRWLFFLIVGIYDHIYERNNEDYINTYDKYFFFDYPIEKSSKFIFLTKEK